MQALTLSHGRLRIEERQLPSVQAGTVLVQVIASSICSTDLQLMKGYYPFDGVLGHEFVGNVAQVHRENTVMTIESIGRRIVAEINCVCHVCDHCTSQRKTHCCRRRVIGIKDWDGAHAQYVLVPEENCILIPQDMSITSAVMVEPFAAVLQILDQIHIRPGSSLCILGLGRIGRLCLFAFSHFTPAKVTVVYRYEHQVQNINCARTFTALQEQKVTHLSDVFDVVIEATGAADGIDTAARLVRPRGTIVLKSTTADRSSVDLSSLVVKEVSVVGSRCGPMRHAVSLLHDTRLSLDWIVSAQYPFMQALEAMDRVKNDKSVLKVVLRHDED